MVRSLQQSPDLCVLVVEPSADDMERWWAGVRLADVAVDVDSAADEAALDSWLVDRRYDLVFVGLAADDTERTAAVLEALRASGSDAPIVLMTGELLPGPFGWALAQQADALLVKSQAYAEQIALHLRSAARRHQLQRAFEETLQSYRTLFDSAPLPLLIVRPADGVVADANAEAVRLLGMGRPRLLGASLAAVLASDAVTGALERIRMRGFGGIEELAFVRPNAAPRTLRLSARAIRLGFEDTLQVILEDRTRERDLEESRRRVADRLTQGEKLAALGHMVAGVAHELNNPMSVIVGLSRLLQEESDLDRYQEDIHAIAESAERCNGIIQSLLKFTRLHAAEVQQVDVNEVITLASATLRPSCEVDGIQLELDLDPTLPRTEADPDLLQQVFVALVHNAREAMREANEGTTISLRTSARLGAIRVEVWNDGPIIPDELRRRIFDPFFTTKEVGHGAGLGLSYCYGIVKEHFGEIEVASAPGAGTTFSITLPLGPDEIPGTGGEAEDEELLGMPGDVPDAIEIYSVLCYDADPVVRQGIRTTFFSDPRLHVITTDSMDRLVELASDLDPEVVLVSVGAQDAASVLGALPETDGPRRVVALVEQSQTGHELLELGYVAALVKPLHRQDIEQAVLGLLKLAPLDA